MRLELGPLAASVPSSWHTIRPNAADVVPSVLEKSECSVLVITAERTFWEKATILHQEAHRAQLIPIRYSRHYYDLCRMAQSPVREKALADLALLDDVVQCKERFYPCTWARYDLALPGSFRLLPASEEHVKELQADYRDMQVMLFGDAPTFDEIISVLARLERQINGLQRPLGR